MGLCGYGKPRQEWIPAMTETYKTSTTITTNTMAFLVGTPTVLRVTFLTMAFVVAHITF